MFIWPNKLKKVYLLSHIYTYMHLHTHASMAAASKAAAGTKAAGHAWEGPAAAETKGPGPGLPRMLEAPGRLRPCWLLACRHVYVDACICIYIFSYVLSSTEAQKGLYFRPSVHAGVVCRGPQKHSILARLSNISKHDPRKNHYLSGVIVKNPSVL